MIINIDALGPLVSEIFRVKQTIFVNNDRKFNSIRWSTFNRFYPYKPQAVRSTCSSCIRSGCSTLHGRSAQWWVPKKPRYQRLFPPGQLQAAFSCTHKTWARRFSGPFTCWGESLQWLQRLWLYQRPWASAGLGGLAAACAGTCVLWDLQSDSLSPLEPYCASLEKGKAGACKPRWTRETWDKTVKP